MPEVRRCRSTRPWTILPAVVLAVVTGGGARATAQQPAPASSPLEDAAPTTPGELLERLGNAWFARDIDGYLALWAFETPAQREVEAAIARQAFAADETQISILGRPRHGAAPRQLGVDVQVFTATEPRASVQFWRLRLRQTEARWAIVERDTGGGMEGLIHLPLAPESWRVRDVTLDLEDFTLVMEDGSLFHTPDAVGATALVFVGKGRVRYSPRPPGEREQLRQYSKDPELDREVKWAFIRLAPEDLSRVLDVTRLEPDPQSARRREEAEKRWRERAPRSFLVDAPLPRSPWWLSPAIGDAVVDFPWKGSRVLTYALAGNEPEDVNLFERDRHLKICSYPSRGRPRDYSEDEGRQVDVLRHELVVRFDPDRLQLSAVDTLHLRFLSPVSTVRLKLDNDFAVSSVTAEDGRSLLFLRLREQDGLVVSLGALAGQADEMTLTVRYAGHHDPGAMDRELLQVFREEPPDYADRVLLGTPPVVYANRTAWYPRPDNEDFATLHVRLDTPDDHLAVTGGELVSTRTADGRVSSEFHLAEPGKYFTAIVGRLTDVGVREEGPFSVRGFADSRTGSETRDAMERALRILAFYAERYGPCPYPRLNVVVAEDRAPGGHSPPGLVYLKRRPATLRFQPLPPDPADFGDQPDFFLAHELAHQWWGQGTAAANYREQWLSEAWAQYSAALWARHVKGEDAFHDMLDEMARWARRYDDEGAIHLGQRLGHLEHDARIQRAVVYDKGAWVLHMLHNLLGDEVFFAGARLYLAEHRFAKAGTPDLRRALEETSGRDLGPYFEKWIYDTGLPTLRWTSRTQGTPDGARTTIEVRPQELPGPLPLEITVTTREGVRTRRVEVPPAGGSWAIDTEEPPRRVEINEDRGILAETERVGHLPPLQ
jgi:hypothetical protein